MHHHNHYYGQAHILARYCGFDDEFPPRIRGYLQHGWNVGDGWNPQHEFFDGAWRYVWSERPARRGYSERRHNYHVIGAPWLYLLELEPDLGVVPEDERRGTLWMPFHGWEGGKITGDHQALIDEIKDTETEPVTMSLYYTEYDQPEIREIYLDAGFEVMCFGRRGWNYEGTDTRFLYKQLEAFRGFKRVASNRLATAIFYGVSVGCEPSVYGDPMSLPTEDPLFGGYPRVRRLWPEMVEKVIDPAVARAITDEELGVRYRLPPQELAMLLYDAETNND
ncbi:hypothetical protein GA0111570_102412 [Raineyella antarctica]|uniref:Uncharacterized protein n=1 Tax=Raineyella antarctica TaxID=1577474 RepID=A0A1G6GF38_9ACTN|nr:hypothetical protein [Raineyella antarctica]SDB80621.1 hypothetical protein GA0111570_102412 [Raineyella antarctica]